MGYTFEYTLLIMTHLFKQKTSNNYSIRFRKSVDGKRFEKTFSLKTSSKRVAQQLETRLLADQQLGKIDVFNIFDFEAWKNPASTPSNNKLVSSLIQHFLNEATHLNEKSKAHYEMVLNLFSKYVGSTMMIQLLQREDITKFVFNSKYSISTQNNYLRHIKTFFKWVKKKGYGTDITIDVKPQKVPETVKDQIISEAELNKILQIFKNYIRKSEKEKLINNDKQRQLWFQPLIVTAFYTGLRQSELLDLKWKHIDFKNNQVTVVAGKGGKSRTTVLLKPAKEILLKWKKKSIYERDRFVFESAKSMTGHSVRMTNRTAARVFKNFVAKAELSDSIHFHSLRHSCATYLLKQRFSVHEVQKMMGHSSISVTERYLHLVPQDLNDKAKQLGLI